MDNIRHDIRSLFVDNMSVLTLNKIFCSGDQTYKYHYVDGLLNPIVTDTHQQFNTVKSSILQKVQYCKKFNTAKSSSSVE